MKKSDSRYVPPRSKIDIITSEIISKNTKNPGKDDVKNRRNVQQKIFEYMDKGMTNEEAVDMVMQDEEIVEQFKYLKKNGLDIKQCFINWTKWKQNKKNNIKDTHGDER